MRCTLSASYIIETPKKTRAKTISIRQRIRPIEHQARGVVLRAVQRAVGSESAVAVDSNCGTAGGEFGGGGLREVARQGDGVVDSTLGI